MPYTYCDANWKDKLTAYNGQSITYDAIGNPLNDGTWNYTWTVGRQLTQMAKDGMTVQYRYDHNGLRVAKIVNGVETKCILNGKQLTHLHRGNDWMHFFYDIQGRPAKVRYNGTIYSYIHNLQGDIVGIIDIDGNVVVEYKYDAWGKLLSTIGSLAGSLGNFNPLRYRGYVYDEETGLYYLRSRYYNAATLRMISSDEFVVIGTEIAPSNLFYYGRNNPGIYVDSDGRREEALVATPQPPDEVKELVARIYDVELPAYGYKSYSEYERYIVVYYDVMEYSRGSEFVFCETEFYFDKKETKLHEFWTGKNRVYYDAAWDAIGEVASPLASVALTIAQALIDERLSFYASRVKVRKRRIKRWFDDGKEMPPEVGRWELEAVGR